MSFPLDLQPACTNEESGTQIFYALRYAPPPDKMGYFTTLYRDDKNNYNHVEPWDDEPVEADDFEEDLDTSTRDTAEKLELIQNEKSTRVIAKLTSRSDIVQAEMSKREEHQLSRHYVPAIISVHHTIQHAAYAEAMAEPSYCITMEGAETTAENLLLDLRRSGGSFSKDHLKSIAISLFHIHERGLVHGDFGTHNVAKFGNRWKVLGIGGSINVGDKTNPKRGFFHPPEAVVLETRNVSLGEKNVGAAVVPIVGSATYDIWAFGTIMYEALAGLPLSPYRSAYKAKRAMTTAELFKVGQWDQRNLRKALRHIEGDDDAQDLIKKLLNPDPELRAQSMREALEHPYFGLGPLTDSPAFTKTSSAQKHQAPGNVLKMYTDEYMSKIGITDEDIMQLLMPKETISFDLDGAIEEEQEDDEGPNPAAEVNEPKVQEIPSKIDTEPSSTKPTEEKAAVGSTSTTDADRLMQLAQSPARPTQERAAGDSVNMTDADRLMQLATASSPMRKKVPSASETPTVKVDPPKPASTPAQKTVQPQAPAPPQQNQTSTPQPTPQATKSKSRFSMGGFKSKLGKK